MLNLRVKQLKRRDENLKKAALHLRRFQKQSKKLFNDSHQLQKASFKEKDLMLIHNFKLNTCYNLKLAFK